MTDSPVSSDDAPSREAECRCPNCGRTEGEHDGTPQSGCVVYWPPHEPVESWRWRNEQALPVEEEGREAPNREALDLTLVLASGAISELHTGNDEDEQAALRWLRGNLPSLLDARERVTLLETANAALEWDALAVSRSVTR